MYLYSRFFTQSLAALNSMRCSWVIHRALHSHVCVWHRRLCRYNAFLLLYPTGVVSEMLLLYWGVPYVRQRDLYSIHMPNRWNFAWDYAIFIEVRAAHAMT